MIREQRLHVDSPSKPYWDFIEEFQTKASLDSPSGMTGVACLRRIRNILEPYWINSPQRSHPLRTRFLVAYEPHYAWFCHFARRLEEVTKIPAHENALARLGSPEEFANAWTELDFALRIHLEKFQCQFVKQATKPTPDLECQIGRTPVSVEVSSLNEAEDDIFSLKIIDFAFPHEPGLVAGGLVSWLPNRNEFDKVKNKIVEATKEAKETNQKVEILLPGQLRYYVAPDNLADLIPPRWRGHFELGSRTPTSKKDRLIQKIDSKAKNQLSTSSGSSVLVVYDRFSTPEDAQRLSENRDVSIKIGTLKNLACVILVLPISPIHAVQPQKKQSDGITYIEQRLPDREAEKCIVWENPAEDHSRVVQALVSCLTEFPTNLVSLFDEAHE